LEPPSINVLEISYLLRVLPDCCRRNTRRLPSPTSAGLFEVVTKLSLENSRGSLLTPEAMRLRRSTVEHPFATIKYRIFGHPRLLMRGLSGARVEIGLAMMAYNLKRITNVLGAAKLTKTLQLA
jgi:Transposase DDE domain